MGVPELWTIPMRGDPAKYDLDAAPIKTYCGECGHETGEEQPHATDCPCLSCTLLHFHPTVNLEGGKSIHFRQFATISPLETEAK